MILLGVLALLLQQSDPAELIKEARKLNSEGKQAEALVLYQQVLDADNNTFDAQLGAGIALDLQGNFEVARRHLRRAIEIAPPQSKTQALKAMAISYAFERNPDEASKYEQRVFDTQIGAQDFVGAAETANELARLYIESGDLGNARKWYQTGHDTARRKSDLTPAESDLWELRWENAQARMAARRHNPAEAQKHAAAVKAILDKGTNPDQTRFYPYLLGYLAFYADDYRTAITELRKADQRDLFVLYLLALADDKVNNQSDAQGIYRTILAMNMHNPGNAFARPIAKQRVRNTEPKLPL